MKTNYPDAPGHPPQTQWIDESEKMNDAKLVVLVNQISELHKELKIVGANYYEKDFQLHRLKLLDAIEHLKMSLNIND